VSDLSPSGTVTLLLAEVEKPLALWETQTEEMTTALARLDRTVSDAASAHGGVRPEGQDERGGVLVAFARASDAVRCALALQLAPLVPLRLRVTVHTDEVQLGGDGKYIGSAVSRVAGLRDIAHGGQTLLSGATEAMVLDRLPPDAWLSDLGTHRLPGLSRPERILQLCHRDLRIGFPALRTPSSIAAQHLPVQHARFVGRAAEIIDVRRIVAENRMVTLTGAGGAGKTRLAVEVATELAGEFGDGVWLVDLAPITDPHAVPRAAAHALDVPEQPGRSTMDTLLRFIRHRQMLVVLDSCEHLLDACAALAGELLRDCPGLTLLATSREPIGVAGELTWRTPSLSPVEAIELFTDRARRARPGFTINEDNSVAIAETCRRLDGMPLAIELAAARVGALSVREILDGLHDRFRLLTGRTHTAVRRQQTLYASVDWSHALLTRPERVLFRRLGVFMDGFDLDAAQTVASGDDVERYQVLDQLTLLVDKSLVVAEEHRGRTRYRLLETVRQYALERLGDAGDAHAIRSRHRDHYMAMAALLDEPARSDHERLIEWAETEIDNLHAAFDWSRDNSEAAPALQLASSLQPLWLARGRIKEGMAWFDAVLTEENACHADVPARVRGRALADKALLNAWTGGSRIMEQADQAVAVARAIDDPALLARALSARCLISPWDPKVGQPYFAEAIGLARTAGDRWRVSQILGWKALGAYTAGYPIETRAAADEAGALADAVGDRFQSRQCRIWIGRSLMLTGDLAAATSLFREVVAEAEAAHDLLWWVLGLGALGEALAYQGDPSAARAASNAAVALSPDLGEFYEFTSYAALALAELAAADIAAAQDATEAARQKAAVSPRWADISAYLVGQAALARGDVAVARRWADESAAKTSGWHRSMALTTRARCAMANCEAEQADRDVHDALASATDVGAQLGVPDSLECLAALAGAAGSYREAARYLGAAQAIRQRTGQARFRIYNAGHEATVIKSRDELGGKEFEVAWAEGAALSIKEAIAYAQRGRGERKRPTTGWASLTPTERDVVRLVSEGLSNKGIATRLFISPRTVQTHLTHVYTKLGFNSRVQLAQEAARHA
jgi:predicted ATPase/class 3 adenylate cyclase/DNA-binding CsgD family transcriptional regulator